MCCLLVTILKYYPSSGLIKQTLEVGFHATILTMSVPEVTLDTKCQMMRAADLRAGPTGKCTK